MNLSGRIIRALFFAASGLCSLVVSAATLTLESRISIEVPSRWQPSRVEYRNALELVVLTKKLALDTDLGREKEVESPEAQLLISSELRRSHTDALKRLADIAASRHDPVRFVVIGGWPALEVTFVEPQAQRGKDPAEARNVQKAVTAIAVGDRIQRFDISLAPDADSSLLLEAQGLARSVKFPTRGDPAKAKEAIRKLSVDDANRRLRMRPDRPGSTAPTPGAASFVAKSADTGAAVLVQNGIGELEVASSADANTVIVASNQALVCKHVNYET